MSTLKPHTVDWAQIGRFLESADKKWVSAQKILAIDEEVSLEQAYGAMLRASLAFMFSHGVRPRSQPGHHIAIIEFVRQRIDKKHASLLTVFDHSVANATRPFTTTLDLFPSMTRRKHWQPPANIST